MPVNLRPDSAIQPSPDGLAQAFTLVKSFLEGNPEL